LPDAKDAGVVFGAIAAIAPGAFAQTDPRETAQAYFEAGRRYLEQGDCAAALPRFVQSLRLEEGVGAHLSYATCATKLGDVVGAWNHYRGAERIARTKGDEQRARFSAKAASDLEPSVVRLRIALPPNEDLRVTLDGRTLEKYEQTLLPTGLAVSANETHSVIAEAGTDTWRRDDLRGAPGTELPSLSVTFGPSVVPAPPTPTAPGAERDGATREAPPSKPALDPAMHGTGIILAGAGAASMLAGGVFGLLAQGSLSGAKDACTAGGGFAYPQSCNPTRRDDVLDANSRASTQATIASIALIGGVALVAAGAVLFFTSQPRHARTEGRR